MRRVVLGVSGSIAATKAPEIVRRLRRAGLEVRVAMTPAATRFVGPLTFEALSGAPVYLDSCARTPRETESCHGATEEGRPDDSSDRGQPGFTASGIAHTDLTANLEALVVAPASADIIAKIALGLGDDAVSVLALAHPANAPLLVAPAMNPRMWANPAVQENIARLERRGAIIIGPAEGDMACGDVGPGRMSEPDEIAARTLRALASRRADRAPRRILILSGPTREAIDDVRFLSNGSSGRMGAALAEAAFASGDAVTVVSGPAAVQPPRWIRTIRVESAEEMLAAARSEIALNEAIGVVFDVIISPAAIADWRPERRAGKPEKTTCDAIKVSRTPDVLATLAADTRQAGRQTLIVAFTATDEAEDPVAARRKAAAKGADFIVVNAAVATMGAETARVTVLSADGDFAAPIGPASKNDLAREIWTALLPA